MKQVIAYDVAGNTYEVPTSELSFWISAYGVIRSGNKILVLPHVNNGFDFPGGTIEMGEKLEDGLVREVYEETGLTVTPSRLLGAFTAFYKSHKDGHFAHCILLYYLCDYIEGELSDNGFSQAEKQYAQMPCFKTFEELSDKTFMNGSDFEILKQKISPFLNKSETK